jgi:hypothetical protein
LMTGLIEQFGALADGPRERLCPGAERGHAPVLWVCCPPGVDELPARGARSNHRESRRLSDRLRRRRHRTATPCSSRASHAGPGEAVFARDGTRAVFIARLRPLARTFVSLPAGARCIPLIPFIALTAAGCVLWALAFVLAGMLAGGAWATVNSLIGRPLLGAGLPLLTASLLRRRDR